MKTVKAWALCGLWMLFIFLMSATPGPASSAQSGLISDVLIALCGVLPGRPRLPEDVAVLIVRKGAHMAEYAVLFLLCHRAFRKSGARRPGVFALALCVLYAATDEFHQLFVPGRGGSPFDVAIDTAGASIAWLAMRAFAPLIARFRHRMGREDSRS